MPSTKGSQSKNKARSYYLEVLLNWCLSWTIRAEKIGKKIDTSIVSQPPCFRRTISWIHRTSDEFTCWHQSFTIIFSSWMWFTALLTHGNGLLSKAHVRRRPVQMAWRSAASSGTTQKQVSHTSVAETGFWRNIFRGVMCNITLCWFYCQLLSSVFFKRTVFPHLQRKGLHRRIGIDARLYSNDDGIGEKPFNTIKQPIIMSIFLLENERILVLTCHLFNYSHSVIFSYLCVSQEERKWGKKECIT